MNNVTVRGDRYDRLMAALYRAHAEYAPRGMGMPLDIARWYIDKCKEFAGEDEVWMSRARDVVREYDLGIRLGNYIMGERLGDN